MHPQRCERCGHTCGADAPPGTPVTSERRQVFDVPPLHVICSEHRVSERARPHYGATTQGSFHPDVRTVVQNGPGVLAAGVALTAQHLIPLQRAADVLTALTGQRVSPATLVAAERRLVAGLGPVLACVRVVLAGRLLLHFDETGFFVATERR